MVEIKCEKSSSSIFNNYIVGQTYYVRLFVANSNIYQDVDFSICIGTPPTPPQNDECLNAIQLIPSSTTTCTPTSSGSVVNALESLNSTSGCNSSNYKNDIWYYFIASNTSHRINLSDINLSNPGLILSVYGGTCDSLWS